jgi:hypothetical protein
LSWACIISSLFKLHIVLKVERWKISFKFENLPMKLHQEGNQTIEQGTIVWEPRASTQSEWQQGQVVSQQVCWKNYLGNA